MRCKLQIIVALSVLSVSALTSSPGVKSTKHAIIIGAGPGGIATAGFLAKEGWTCDVYESGTEERATQTSLEYMDRAYGLSCQNRAIDVLRQLNALDDVFRAGGYWRKGRYHHAKHGKPIPLFDSQELQTLSCLRTELVCGMLNAVRRDWNDKITFHWESIARRIIENNSQEENEESNLMIEIEFKNETLHCLTADAIICADGYNSFVGRRNLAQLDSTFRSQSVPSGLLTKSILCKAPKSWIPQPESLHFVIGRDGMILLGRDTGPRPSLRPGILTMMVYPESSKESLDDVDSQTLKKSLKEVFTEVQLPVDDVISEEDLARCAQTKGIPLPGTVSCSHYHYKNFVLIGDAAHGTPTIVAQGVNCALQDAYILSGLIKDCTDSGRPVEQALEQFTKTRKPEMDALQRMMSHPFFQQSIRPTWRTRVVDKLRWTRLPFLQPLQTQISMNRLPYSRLEMNMLLQYHAPLVVAAVFVAMASWTLTLGAQHLLQVGLV